MVLPNSNFIKRQPNNLSFHTFNQPSHQVQRMLALEMKSSASRRGAAEKNTKPNINDFKKTLTKNGYPKTALETAKRGNRRTNEKRDNSDIVYFNFPFFNNQIQRKVHKVFREANLPVRIYNKSQTLRQVLRKKDPPNNCTWKDCRMSETKLCFRRNCVYKILCERCHNFYIGSTVRYLHARFHEHLTRES